MEGKKISFGFLKTKKADKPVIEEKKDFIECVEEKAIKVVGGEEVKENTPLVIPMKPNTLITAERLKQIAEQVESALEEPEIDEKPPIHQENAPENETLDQMAVRELLQSAKKEVNIETPQLTVPMPAKPVNEGEKESTLDDYEAVPVQDFGMAMLRGMGWAQSKEKSTYKPPQLRPKGLGLGADKVLKGNPKSKSSKDGKEEELTIIKNAYVKITTGKYSGYYGKVVSLDEDNGRVMVDITVKKETVSLSEFMMHPVPKSEFDKESKVINAGSFDEYNRKEALKKSSKYTDKESTPDRSKDRNNKEDTKNKEREATTSRSTENRYDRDQKSRYEEDKGAKNGKDKETQDGRERDRDRSNRSRQRRDSTEEKRRKKDKRYSSSDSLGSLSDSETKRQKKKERKTSDSLSSSDTDKKKRNKNKERRRRDSSASESDHRSKRHKTPEGKRDIDKKRKGKKKKRDRDRSPNYRKHRK